MRRRSQHNPEPSVRGRRAQREPHRVDAIKLLSQPVGEAQLFLLEFLDDATQLAEVDDLGIVGAYSPKRPRIRTQSICEDARVSRIILRATHAKAIAKPIDLLRIDRKHDEPVL